MHESHIAAKSAEAGLVDPLAECRGFALACLPMAYSQSLVDIQAVFSSRAGSLDELSLQTSNVLRHLSGDLAASFQWHLADLMSGNVERAAAVTMASGLGQASLMLEEEHHDFTAPDVLASAIGSGCNSEIYGLDKRFEFLARPQAHRELAFGPRTIGMAVMQSLKACGLPLGVRQQLLPMLAEHLPANVGAVFRALNRAMIVRGILPAMRVGAMGKDDTHAVSHASWDWISPHIQPAAKAPAAIPAEVMTKRPLQRHLNALQPDQGLPVSKRDIERWLENGDNLAREIEGAMPSGLESADKVLLNWMAVLFDGIFMRPMDAAFRTVLCRAQWPLLRAMLQDKERLIDNLEHPAQRLLGAWVVCADEHGPETEGGQAALGKMQAILSELSSASMPDFNRAWAQWQNQAVPEPQASGQEDVERYVEPIRAAIKERRIPAGIESFLVEHRLSVLRGIASRFGEHGAEWRDAVAVLDKLLITLEPRNWRKERQAMTAWMPAMLDRLRANMELAGLGAKASERFFGMLAKYHSILLNSAQGRPASSGERQP